MLHGEDQNIHFTRKVRTSQSTRTPVRWSVSSWADHSCRNLETDVPLVWP